MEKVNTKICLIIPSLIMGGMERVMSEIANYLTKGEDVNVHLILLSKKEHFFSISEKITIHEPQFSSNNKVILTFKLAIYLRKKLKKIRPISVLSFGSMYNSFVILASLGLGIRIFVSDRSNPYRNTYISFKKDPIKRHDGIFHYFLRRLIYPLTSGILVQTQLAKEIEQEFSGHKNIILFPNPVRNIEEYPTIRVENWIINVGRFIKTKNQLLLIEIFSKIQNTGWKLVFAGDGPELDNAKKLTAKLKLHDRILFLGEVSNIDWYLRKSKIFAFASSSEGFPNALAEAMNASLACISFDCIAGPKDIIENGVNGFLIPNGSVDEYKTKLDLLMKDENLRQGIQKNAKNTMKKFQKSILIEKLKSELIRN